MLLHAVGCTGFHRVAVNLPWYRTPAPCARLSSTSAENRVAFTVFRGLRIQSDPSINGPGPCRFPVFEMERLRDPGRGFMEDRLEFMTTLFRSK